MKSFKCTLWLCWWIVYQKTWRISDLLSRLSSSLNSNQVQSSCVFIISPNKVLWFLASPPPRPPEDPDDTNARNSKNIKRISFIYAIDTLRAIEQLRSQPNDTLSPKSLKCNTCISKSNLLIGFKFDTGMKYLKLHKKNCQWLPKLHSLTRFLYPPILAISPWIMVRLL